MKDKYEISVWEDYYVSLDSSGDTDLGKGYYDERKLAVIGSDTITADCRAYEPKMIENVNGTHTFTFKMYYVFKAVDIENVKHQFYTDDSEPLKLKEGHGLNLVWTEIKSNSSIYENPFLGLLVNERKIKVFWKDEWYDLIIKNCQEDSNGKSITYTCKDLYVNELSKTGFDLEFDNELKNNQGTAAQLGEKVVEGTDWVVEEGDTIQQKTEEPLYECGVVQSFYAKNESAGGTEEVTEEITEHTIFYGFYSYLDLKAIEAETEGKEIEKFQFLWRADGNYKTDLNQVIINNANNYSIEKVKIIYDPTNFGTYRGFKWNGSDYDTEPIFEITKKTISDYRGERLVETDYLELDTLTGKYCYVYEGNGDKYYCYEETEYLDATYVVNLISNSSNFVDTKGWTADGENSSVSIDYTTTDGVQTYLTIKGAATNNGLNSNAQYLPEGIKEKEEFVLSCEVKSGNGKFDIGYYDEDDNWNSALLENNISISSSEGLKYVSFKTGLTRLDLFNYKIKINSDSDIKIKNIQFFKYVEDEDGEMITPDSYDKKPLAKQVFTSYKYDEDITDKEKIVYTYHDDLPSEINNIPRKKNENFEKIRSISVKNSNRFNILQEIAETFECWCRFKIAHDETGRISRDENGKPIKTITFIKEVGKQTGVVFTYGIDLKSISRTIQSDQIVTKTIVKQNNNQFGKNGFCSIARSKENYPRSNFILDFGYYINQGLLDGNQLNKDLYSSIDNGYYFALHNLNLEYDRLAELLSQKEMILLKFKSLKETQVAYKDSIDQEKTQLAERFKSIFHEDIVKSGSSLDSADAVSMRYSYANLTGLLSEYTTKVTNIENAIASLEKEIDHSEKEEGEEDKGGLKQQLQAIKNDIKAQDANFNKKYARYIQEGSWTDEKYIDDNLYYLDGKSVAYTSSRPQISYNISVMRISSLEGFEAKIFKVGDIAAVQDTEFFGYVTINGYPTPYKEKVTISEITSNFDAPEQDSFKVQNYKTQFEDLFQRITSSTQNLQYAAGEYARAASVVNTDGTIKVETLRESFKKNIDLVYSAQNEAIKTDNTGITLVDLDNPDNRTKITSGGIFISTDGGRTWNNAIKGGGISANNITSGAINTRIVQIAGSPTTLGTREDPEKYNLFSWTDVGLNAIGITETLEGKRALNDQQFVRLDRFGLYGIDSKQGINYTKSFDKISDIKEKATFGLLWDGFFLNSYNNGQYRTGISTEKDFYLDWKQNDEEWKDLIRIGRRNTSNENSGYGFFMNDKLGNSILEFSTTGNDDNAQLKLTGIMYIDGDKTETGEERIIQIGYINEGNGRSKTIDVNDKFIVWSDGSVKAAGEITATTGQIGPLVVDQYGGLNRVIVKREGSEPSLEITDDNFIIRNKFYINDDLDNHLLSFEKGTLEITGTINANEGSIGGWKITNNGIESENGNIKLLSKEEESEKGKIYAQDIELGEGAYIKGIMKFGEYASLYNPNNEDYLGKFIEIKSKRKENEGNIIFLLEDNGVLTIGDSNSNSIEINGNFASISGSEKGSGHYFEITPEMATFENVNVSGKISTAIFEVDRVQAMGGAMIFKPSYKVSKAVQMSSDLYLELEDLQDIRIDGDEQTRTQSLLGNYVYLINNDGRIINDKPYIINMQEKDQDKNYVMIKNFDSLSNTITGLIDIGQVDDILIGVNSTNNNIGVDAILKRGFTISQLQREQKNLYVEAKSESEEYELLQDSSHYDLTYSEPDSKISCKLKTFLGDLSQIEISEENKLSGYGLYSDNVYLHGSLITEVIEETGVTYAGVNTNSNVSFNIKKGGDTSPIVFWAGADSLSDDDIQKAPLQITKKGTIYAINGFFQGSVFVDDTLEAPTIKTARITGSGTGEYGLTIDDLSRGILFVKKDKGETEGETKEVPVFSLGSNGIINPSIKDELFGSSAVAFNKDGTLFIGNIYSKTVNLNNNPCYLSLGYEGGNGFELKLLFIGGTNTETGETISRHATSCHLEDGRFYIKPNQSISNKDICFDTSMDLTMLNSSTVKIAKTLELENKLKYSKVDKGYDLYVTA